MAAPGGIDGGRVEVPRRSSLTVGRTTRVGGRRGAARRRWPGRGTSAVAGAGHVGGRRGGARRRSPGRGRRRSPGRGRGGRRGGARPRSPGAGHVRRPPGRAHGSGFVAPSAGGTRPRGRSRSPVPCTAPRQWHCGAGVPAICGVSRASRPGSRSGRAPGTAGIHARARRSRPPMGATVLRSVSDETPGSSPTRP